MRLSEAIMLGSTTCKMVVGDWNSCALGCAGNAIGIAQGESKTEVLSAGNEFVLEFEMSDDRHRREHIRDAWPWIEDRAGSSLLRWESKIFMAFDEDVCRGHMTLEQLVDYVRSIEPSCGDCNRFACTCDKAASPESITQDVCVTEAA